MCFIKIYRPVGSHLKLNGLPLMTESILLCCVAVYQDTLNGCPTRSTNPAVNDATRINSTNPRAFRPTGMTPLDGNSNRALPLNSSFDPWYYYQLSPIYQVLESL